LEDKELIAKYKTTKDQAFLAELFGRYKTQVYGSCMTYYKNTADAEDAVMEIYEKLVKKVITSDITYFKSWLYTVTRNHCLEKLRKISTHEGKKSNAELMYYDDLVHPDNVDKEVELTQLEVCIGRLEANQKKCVTMFYYEKKSYADISEALDLGVGQVRSRIQNGRRNLKNCMEQHVSKSK